MEKLVHNDKEVTSQSKAKFFSVTTCLHLTVPKRGRKACQHVWLQMLMWIHLQNKRQVYLDNRDTKDCLCAQWCKIHELKRGFQWLRYKTDTKICDCQTLQEQFWWYVEETFGRAVCWFHRVDINYLWKLQLEWTFFFWVSSCFFFISDIKNGKIWLKTRYSMPDSACNIEFLTLILQYRICSLLPFNNDMHLNCICGRNDYQEIISKRRWRWLSKISKIEIIRWNGLPFMRRQTAVICELVSGT